MKFIFLLSALLIGIPKVWSQYTLSTETLNAAGSYFETSEYRLSSNIGEMSLVNTVFLPDYILSNGVLQPLIHLKKPVSQTDKNSLRIYPTLTANNQIYLETQFQKPMLVKISAYTLLGQLVNTNQLSIENESQKQTIIINGLSKGTYLIIVSLFDKEGNKVTDQTFRIEKI